MAPFGVKTCGGSAGAIMASQRGWSGTAPVDKKSRMGPTRGWHNPGSTLRNALRRAKTKLSVSMAMINGKGYLWLVFNETLSFQVLKKYFRDQAGGFGTMIPRTKTRIPRFKPATIPESASLTHSRGSSSPGGLEIKGNPGSFPFMETALN